MKHMSGMLAACFLVAGCQSGQQATGPANQAEATEAPVSPMASTPEPQPKATSWDGPFGVQMGLTKQQVLDATGAQALPDRPFTYVASTAPRGHIDFPNYAYTIGNQAGLCSIVGLGDEFDTDSFGNAVRGRFASLEDALTKKYGEPTSTNKSLASGSIWNEPRDWIMGLAKGERSYRVEWTASAAHPLPDHLVLIRLGARAPRSDRGALGIWYQFENEPACDKEVAAARDASL